ncbi:MAG: DUF1835 domain-containing protein [Pyrinomonadaceae bacterium]|nr:DUF1835 domain-containing protein [Pyrinomonadaceae bacterium]
MIYHILNGDSLANGFNLEGEKIICRECLIEGDLQAKNLAELWKVRAELLRKTYGADDYFENVKSEFDKLNDLKPNDEVNLWFGNEAFCQVNLWLFLNLLESKEATIYRIFPDSDDWNCSFENLEKCFESRQKLTKEDVWLGKKLWKAYCFQNFDSLKTLSQTKTKGFLNLPEVCLAIIEKETQPKKILQRIIENGETDFGKIFNQFREKAAIYGFGDLQVKNILKEI